MAPSTTTPLPAGLTFRWLTAPEMVGSTLHAQLLACWCSVSNAGGAVGFPFLPVRHADVVPALDALVSSLESRHNRLLLAEIGDTLAGWLLLAGNDGRLTSHWANVLQVQTALTHRGLGVGRALMGEVARGAREDLGLEHLHLELRSGAGLESFYRSCGWETIGAWPGALRLSPNDDRDEVLMFLRLR